jgi:hypothetical protein
MEENFAKCYALSNVSFWQTNEKLNSTKITYQHNWPCYLDVECRVLRQQDGNRTEVWK